MLAQIISVEMAMKSQKPESNSEAKNQGPAPDSLAVSQVMPLVYDELRRLARHYLKREKAGYSLQATALVNEAYLRLKLDKKRPWRDRTHFFAIAANSMRRILVERARARDAAKRGGGRIRITLDEGVASTGEKSIDLLALDEALTRLAGMDPDQARIVELRFFTGLSIEETAKALEVSPATVKRGWDIARAWLLREMQREKPK